MSNRRHPLTARSDARRSWSGCPVDGASELMVCLAGALTFEHNRSGFAARRLNEGLSIVLRLRDSAEENACHRVPGVEQLDQSGVQLVC